MAKIKNPILFSQHFAIAESKLADYGLMDPFLNVDTQLFIDPMLLEKSSNESINERAYPQFCKHFSDYIRLLAISKAKEDAAWKAAKRQINLSEPPQTGLGYGGSRRSGASRPEEVRSVILQTSKEIVELGANDPEMISLMGFFEENVGPDTISDFTTWVILDALADITNKFCQENNIPMSRSVLSDGIDLPTYNDKHIVLVPLDIVRDLPIAKDFSEIHDAAGQNQKIRDRVNKLLGVIAKPTVTEIKEALRKTSLESAENLNELLSAIKSRADHYDPNADILAYLKMRDILRSDISAFKSNLKFDIKNGPGDLKHLVMETIEQFKHHVEKGNLWEELWNNDKPKKERAAQLIYFAIADCFCKVNNIDISPEANMGGGPVDFKFSEGYEARVVVEMKRSGGAVKHGYEKQLEIYKDASRTEIGVFVVVDFGDMGGKLNQINKIRSQRLRDGEPASDIVVIDATKKISASKRKL